MSRFRVVLNERDLSLTPKEFEIFTLLSTHKRCHSKMIRALVWPDVRVCRETMYTHITNLRKKLKDHGVKIVSRRDEGFSLVRAA